MESEWRRRIADAVPSWFIPALIAASTCIVFLPAVRNGFVNLDDDKNLLNNLAYRGLDWSHFRWFFTTRFLGPYQPLTWLSWSLDYACWGMNPAGYHATSILLHAANAALFYHVGLRLLTKAHPPDASASALRLGAAVSALLFALHPLRVESVVWISERRDVLSGFFYLIAVACYLRRRRSAAVGAFVLALLAKATAIALPFTLLILDVYPLGRLPADAREWSAPKYRPILLEKAWFAVCALLIGLTTFAGHLKAGMVRPLTLSEFPARAARAAFGLAFYLYKTVLPLRLLPVYEWSSRLDPWSLAPIAAMIAMAAITAGLFSYRRRWPSGLAVWLHYCATLLPLLGFIAIPSHLVADRYSYLSCLGWPLLAGGGLASLLRRDARPYPLFAALGLAAASIHGLTILTLRQTLTWRDSTVLWTRVLSLEPRSAWARNSLGSALAAEGKSEAAIQEYRTALALDESAYLPRLNLADLYFTLGRLDDAVASYRLVLERNPRNAKALNNLGLALARKGAVAEGAGRIREALRIDPRLAEAYNNLGLVLYAQGRSAEAAAQYRTAIGLAPASAPPHVNLAEALRSMGRTDEAVSELRASLAVDGRAHVSHNNLATLLLGQGKREEALSHFEEALRLKPDYAEARENLRAARRAVRLMPRR